MFEFKKFDNLQNDEIKLVLKSTDEPNYDKGYAPRYGYSIIHIQDNEDIGVVYFSVDTSRRQYLVGHLSYGVSPVYSGRNYATKACRLVKEVALAHDMSKLYIGSGYDNIASRKTIEKLGARPITINDVPDEKILDELKENKVDMYVWEISKEN